MRAKTLVPILFAGLLWNAPAATSPKPNIIFIEVDDLSYTYTGVWGSKSGRTPTVDELARSGFVFNQGMCQGVMCGPSRNSLISGKYPHQLGFYQNGDLHKLPESTWTLPAALKRSGYETAWIGKSHLKPFETRKSGDQFNAFFGFDYSVHTLGRALVGGDDEGEGGKADGPNPYMEHLQKSKLLDQYQADAKAKRNSTIPEDDYLDGWFTKNAEDFILGRALGKPLFLWLNYSVPHGPYDVADPYHKPFVNAKMPGVSHPTNFTHPESLIQRTKTFRTDALAVEEQRGFHSNILFMDTQVDRILKALNQKGMLENSWIVFFSDHGVMAGAQNLIHKHTLFRQVTQPSLIIRPPKALDGGKRIEQPVELLDLLPTFLEVAGIEKEKSPSGVSLVPLFSGKKTDRVYAFSEIEKWIAVSNGHHRLIRSTTNEAPFLFDDLSDPENLTNIAEKYPELVQQLGQAIDEWVQKTGPRLPSKTL